VITGRNQPKLLQALVAANVEASAAALDAKSFAENAGAFRVERAGETR